MTITIREAQQILNKVAEEINKAIGETHLLGEFLSCCSQPYVLVSYINIQDNVTLDIKEVIEGTSIRHNIIERTIMAHDRMISLLESDKTKLEGLL